LGKWEPRNAGLSFTVRVSGRNPTEPEKGLLTIVDIAVLAQVLSSLATFVVAAGILYQGREARRARDDEDRPQIIVDADYTGRFTTNIVVRNIGHGIAKNPHSAPTNEHNRNYL
jgi:hypothetical protein